MNLTAYLFLSLLCGIMVSTLDSHTNNLSSNYSGTFFFFNPPMIVWQNCILDISSKYCKCDGVVLVRRCVLQEVQQFAVEQIKEKTTAVLANQESGLFCSSRQSLSTLSSSSLSSNPTIPYFYSVTRAASITSLAGSQNALLENNIREMRVSLPLQV